MAGGTDAHQPHPPTQASGQIDAESGGAGQCEKVVHSRCRRACLRASKDPLWSFHPHHRPCPRRSETDARQHRLQHGPPDLPRTSRNHGMSPFRNGRKRHANTLDRSKDGVRPAFRMIPAVKPPKRRVLAGVQLREADRSAAALQCITLPGASACRTAGAHHPVGTQKGARHSTPFGLAREKWRAPTEEPGGVLWETGTGRRRSSGAKRCGWH